MNFKYDDDTTSGTLTLEGKLTIENIRELKKSFITALDKTDHLLLDHNRAEEFDFSYLQLLLSVIKTSEQLNKKFTVINGSPESFKRLLIKSGFGDIRLFTSTLLNEN